MSFSSLCPQLGTLSCQQECKCNLYFLYLTFLEPYKYQGHCPYLLFPEVTHTAPP